MLAGYVPEERKADIDIISVLADKVPFGILILMELSVLEGVLQQKVGLSVNVAMNPCPRIPKERALCVHTK